MLSLLARLFGHELVGHYDGICHSDGDAFCRKGCSPAMFDAFLEQVQKFFLEPRTSQQDVPENATTTKASAIDVTDTASLKSLLHPKHVLLNCGA
jgi:hypothetical protein